MSLADDKEAEGRVEMPDAYSQGSGRNPRECGMGARGAAAAKDNLPLETTQLMEAAVEKSNMASAYRRVLANKGAPGVDGITVEELSDHLKAVWPQVKEQLLADDYKPSPVLAVDIPKADGKGVRTLGIPTVLDRLIQQALLQILTLIFDPDFSESSFGFRPNRSAHQAVQRTREFVAQGRTWVVDIDLEKFFDRVNHDMLMSRIAGKVEDKRVPRLIRRYLEAGIMQAGIVSARNEGTPQGGPLSPLLSNIMLDDLDKELERRGHAFARYADDCNIHVKTQRSGQRVMASVAAFIEGKLKLKVNRDKSAVAPTYKRSFLSYRTVGRKDPKLRIDPLAVARLKIKVRLICRRGRGRSLFQVISELTPLLRGWFNYFRLAEARTLLHDLDSWIRRKLRCILWRQWKRTHARARYLMRYGLKEERAWRSATNGRGPWWNAGASHMNAAFPKSFFDSLGLLSLSDLLRRIELST